MNKRLLVKLLMLIVMPATILSIVSCQGQATPTPIVGTQSPTVAFGMPVSLQDGRYTDISVADLKTMLAHKDFVLINVHTPYEGKLADTDLLIGYDQIDKNLSKLPSDKNARIVLYCRSGRMSAIAAASLVKDGYSNVWNLVGGMDAWQAAGLSIIK